jgi:hypothetical protein
MKMKSLIIPPKSEWNPRPHPFLKDTEILCKFDCMVGKPEAREALDDWKRVNYDREVKPVLMDFLRSEMDKGQFLPECTTGYVFIVGNDDKELSSLRRGNLQHTLKVIMNHPDDLKIEIRFILYRVKNHEALRKIFTIIDSWPSRTPKEKRRAALYERKGLEDIKFTNLNEMAAAVHCYRKQILFDRDKVRVDPRDSNEWCVEHADSIRAVFEAVGPKECNDFAHIHKTNVMAVFLCIAEEFRKFLIPFVDGVKTGANMSIDDPRLIYHKFLIGLRKSDTHYTKILACGMTAFAAFKRRQRIKSIRALVGSAHRFGFGEINGKITELIDELKTEK